MSRCWVWLVAAIAAGIWGCAGDLQNPERFDPSVAVDAGDDPLPGDDADAAPASCSTDVHTDIIVARCASGACHDAEAPAGNLDLASPDVGVRLIDVASGCNALPLVDGDARGTGYLLEKLGPSPTCGGQMPPGSPLSQTDLDCVTQWVEGL